MTGAVMNPVGAAGTADMSTAQTLSPSYINFFRISAVASRLLVHLRGDSNTDNTEFFNLCLSLARGIDYAVANNEIPPRAADLPNLLKQVCRRKNDPQLQAAVMVLMISVKSACNNGWFSEKEKEELHILSEEIQSTFCSVNVKDMNSNMKNRESTFRPIISTIMSRFYPGMKMGEILSVVEAKPGYDSYITDLHISKEAKSSPDDKIYLFVAQTDDIETSSCITSPQQVNFLLNGEGVDRRTCVHKDPGPQTPTPVTHMLKYGSNLLQAVGQFNGRYIIVVAFMSVASNSSRPALPDYVPPAAAAPDSDNEIIEGPSRISLKCPISFGRIKIPVKGHSCKHLQCFDFDNYVGINSRRPLWRCPHCSQSVCFHDIRIDQSMVKVLKEVGLDVFYVKISADGLWEAITEGNEHSDKPHDTAPLQQESSIAQNADATILDLTEADNEMDTSDPKQDDDKKPSPNDFHVVKNGASSSVDTNNAHRNIAPHMEDAFWREFYSSAHATRMANTRSDATESGPVTSQAAVSNNLQLPHYENSNNIANGINGYVMSPTPPGYATRRPIAVQALPAQTSARTADGDTDRQQYFSRSHLNQHQVSRVTSPPSSQHMTTTQALPGQTSARIVDGDTDRQQHFSRSHLNQHQVSRMTSPPSSQHMTTQNRNQSFVSSQTAAPIIGQVSGRQHASGVPAERFNQQLLNERRHPILSSAQPAPHIRVGGPLNMTGQSHYSMADIHRATQIRSRTPSIPAPIQISGSSVPTASMGEQRGQGPKTSENQVDASADQNWRPTGRMRGSLSGQAYAEALNRFIIHPNQPVQAARPPVLNAPRPFIPPHLQALMANNMRPQAQAQAQAPAPGAGGSGPGSESSMGRGGAPPHQ